MIRCRRVVAATGIAAGIAAALALGSLAASAAWIHTSARGRLHTAESVPPAQVGMVLGAEAYADGTPSPFLAARLNTALALLASGKVQRLLVTGDGSTVGLGETGAMRQYLVDRGVNDALITVDDAGVDTHASCVRAKAAGIDSLTLISQTYHLPRALALCSAAGVEAVGVGDDTMRRYEAEWRSGEIREWFAGLKAVTDVLRDRLP
ncbi:MAG: ElyC/SanA/YdcF family protein [Dermatophilus congolensis]|nr:ElyC/SanA/YdcF family protein [Dermatophilus congolensis]